MGGTSPVYGHLLIEYTYDADAAATLSGGPQVIGRLSGPLGGPRRSSSLSSYPHPIPTRPALDPYEIHARSARDPHESRTNSASTSVALFLDPRKLLPGHGR